MTKQSIKTIS